VSALSLDITVIAGVIIIAVVSTVDFAAVFTLHTATVAATAATTATAAIAVAVAVAVATTIAIAVSRCQVGHVCDDEVPNLCVY
jgi:hypothetical protein